MFNDKQIETLTSQLDSNRIKSRQKGNINLSYLEGFDIIETANKIFGHGNWAYSISKLEQVSSEINQNQNNVICYKAVVQVLVHNEDHTKDISREDVGFGTGIAKTLADANEGGAKEAVTDAIKRTLRSFGNQFGNSLYSKDKNSQNNQFQNHQPQQNYNQSANNTNQQPVQQTNYSLNNQTSQMNNNDAQEYTSLFNIGLNVMQSGNSLIVTGDDIFAKKDSIKACGFRWDGANKQWYKLLDQQQAA